MSPELEELFARVIADRLQRVADTVAEPAPAEPTGEQLRDQALNQVDDHMRLAVREIALEILCDVAREKVEFTADDVLEACNARGVTFKDNRALGAVIKRAEKKLFIRATDRFVNSRNSKKHASPTRVWASNIYSRASTKMQYNLWSD